MDLGEGKEKGRFGGEGRREAVVRMYCMRKYIFFLKKKNFKGRIITISLVLNMIVNLENTILQVNC